MNGILLIQSLLAALIGTACMTVSSETATAIQEREPSKSPGKAVGRILRLFGVPRLEGKSLSVAATWGHWLYGIAWGFVLWILLDPAAVGWPLWQAAPAFFGLITVASQIVPPVFAGVKPSIAYGFRPFVIELWHHLVYAVGATVGFLLVGVPG